MHGLVVKVPIRLFMTTQYISGLVSYVRRNYSNCMYYKKHVALKRTILFILPILVLLTHISALQ